MCGMDTIFSTLMTLQPSGQTPEWIQLVPAGEFSGCDGRGPFVADVQAILQAAQGHKLPVDINHAIDRNSSKGLDTPAVGWIVELQSRPDGIWGRVEWTNRGKELLADRAYGFISPVLLSKMNGEPRRVLAIARASLCNDPGLPQLKSLHTRQNGETAMDKQIRAALGLPEDATPQAVIEAVNTAHTAQAAYAELMTKLRKAAGVDDSVDADTIITTLHSRSQDDPEKTSLEKTVSDLQSQLMSVQNERAREKAEGVIGKAIDEFRIVPALRDHFIARHMKEPEMVEKEIAAMPSLMTAGLKGYQPAENKDGLTADEKHICELMAVDPAKYAETKKTQKETL